MVARTSLLSIEYKIQSCLGSDIYLLVGLPMICLPQLVLFGERRDDIEITTVNVLNIRLGLAFVTSMYTHNFTEVLREEAIKSLSFTLLSDRPTSTILPFPTSLLWNHQSNVIFAVSAARLRGEEYKASGTGIPAGSSFFQAAVAFFA